MAHKRMFSRDITASDIFREMPASAQNLYFHLGMEADDDGFIGAYKTVQRAISSPDDDLKILVAKRFLLQFSTGVLVVKHWLINNTIRKDRYNSTKYLEEKRSLYLKDNLSYTDVIGNGIPLGNQSGIPKLATQNRIEENRRDRGTFSKEKGGRELTRKESLEKIAAIKKTSHNNFKV